MPRVMNLDEDTKERLEARRSAGLLRVMTPQSAPGPVIERAGRTLLNFSSNDYLGLASDSRLVASGPSGAAASRLLTGHLGVHADLEQRLANWIGTERSLLFSSGYAANLGVIGALVGRGDVVFSDALNHASIIDGIRLSRAQCHIYRHGDLTDLEALLQRHRADGRRAMVVSDAIFSMDGDTAPLAGLRDLASSHDAWLYVDEAHALGVSGGGRGACAALGVVPDVFLGTLGKAVGVAGAFVAGSSNLCGWVAQSARSFVFSTGISPLLVSAIDASLNVMEAEPERRERVLEISVRLRRGLRSAGYEIPDSATSTIIPILIGQSDATMQLMRDLEERGILAMGIRPPTVARETSRIRLTAMATHTDGHVRQVIGAFEAIR